MVDEGGGAGEGVGVMMRGRATEEEEEEHRRGHCGEAMKKTLRKKDIS